MFSDPSSPLTSTISCYCCTTQVSISIHFCLVILFFCHFLDDPPPYIDGVRINSPHYLCKIILSDSSPRRFTLVVSQYEKMHTINYTLRAYATCPFTLSKITNPYTYKQEVSD